MLLIYYLKKIMKEDNLIEKLSSKSLTEVEQKENAESERDMATIPTFDEFINLSYEEFGVNCIKFISKFFSNNLYICSLKIYSKDKFNMEIRVQKKLGDFERLYKLINSKYSKMNFQQFPTFSFLTKEEELVNYFDNLLNTIIRTAKDHEEMKIIFLKFIYDFFILDPTKEIISPIKFEIITDMFTKEDSKILKTPKRSSKRLRFSSKSLHGSNKKEKEDKEKEKDKDKEINFEDETIVIDNEWENILIQLTEEKKFTGYIKIASQCLFINRSKPSINIEEDFDFVVPLYKINMDITKIKYNNDNENSVRYTRSISSKEIYDLFYSDLSINNMKLSEINTEIEIYLYHNFSKYNINIIFDQSKTLLQVKNFIEFIENNSLNYDIAPSPYIKTIDEKYTNIYGLLYLKIDSLQISEFSGECLIKVTNLPYSFNTIRITNPDNIKNNIYHINQQFILPIHNRFGKLKFEIYQDVFKGVLIKSKEKEVIYEATIELTKILNEFNDKNIKLHLIFNSVLSEPNIKKKKNILLDDNEKDDKIRTNLYITIKDYCNSFVLLEKYRNKNILEDIEAGDDNLGIKILLKRLKKMFYLFDELNLLYKSIFQFKYPIFSFICMVFILGNIYFTESKYIFTFVINLLIILLISQCQMYKKYLEPYVNKYIFSYKNPYDLKSKIISTKKEVEDRELKNPNYLIEKEELNIITDIIDPLTNINKYKLKYFGFVLKITKYVGTVEKIKNLFLWTDPKLTIYFLFLLIFVYLLIFKIDFKYILLFSMSKKFIIGFFYYRSKYQNNIEVGRILLEHSVVKWREKTRKVTNSFQRLYQSIDLSTIRVYDSNFKSIIADIFAQNSNAVLSGTIFNIINSLKDMQNEIGKCEGILKIRKSSPLYKFIKNNNKILSKEVEPEDVFYYFVQNIKSDFYILRNKEEENNTMIALDDDNQAKRYLSLSSDTFISKNGENDEKNKEDKKENEKSKKDNKKNKKDKKNKEEKKNKKKKEDKKEDEKEIEINNNIEDKNEKIIKEKKDQIMEEKRENKKEEKKEDKKDNTIDEDKVE